MDRDRDRARARARARARDSVPRTIITPGP